MGAGLGGPPLGGGGASVWPGPGGATPGEAARRRERVLLGKVWVRHDVIGKNAASEETAHE